VLAHSAQCRGNAYFGHVEEKRLSRIRISDWQRIVNSPGVPFRSQPWVSGNGRPIGSNPVALVATTFTKEVK